MLSLDYKGWHVWQGAAYNGKQIIANGPDLANRHLEFKSVDDAINWFYVSGHKELARKLNDVKHGKA